MCPRCCSRCRSGSRGGGSSELGDDRQNLALESCGKHTHTQSIPRQLSGTAVTDAALTTPIHGQICPWIAFSQKVKKLRNSILTRGLQLRAEFGTEGGRDYGGRVLGSHRLRATTIQAKELHQGCIVSVNKGVTNAPIVSTEVSPLLIPLSKRKHIILVTIPHSQMTSKA